MKLKKQDNVMVMAGRDKGKTGAVTRLLPATDQVFIEGVNIVKRHTKPSNKNPRGGILEVVRPLPAGKVAFVCPNCKKPSRLGYQMGKSKERICRKCHTVVK